MPQQTMKPMRFKQIVDNLIKFGIIDAEAIEDAHAYDNYATQDAVFAFCDCLNEIIQENQKTDNGNPLTIPIMKITSNHVFEITSNEIADSYMKYISEIILEYSQVSDRNHAEKIITEHLNGIKSDLEEIFVGDVKSLFRQGMSFTLVPGLLKYEKEIESNNVVVFITDRNIKIDSSDIQY